MIATPADAVKPEVKWNGDVNADGRGDLLLVDLGSCSNWGDCPYTLFLTCDSRHVPLWSGYANRVTPTDSQTKWKDLVIVQRNASPDDDHTSQITFRFDGDKYTEVPGSRRRLRSN